MSDPNLTIDDLNALPEKMRAHAAAKAVGMTSKEFLAAMAGIGVEIKSAQSGVTRDVLLTWFNGRSEGDPAGQDPAPPAESATGETATAEETKPAATAPAKKAPAKKSSAKKTATKKTPAKKAESEKPPEMAERTPLPDIAIVTGEVGADEAGNRRRRSTATPGFSPLFLSPAEAAAEADSGKGAGNAPSSESARDESAADIRADGAPADNGDGEDPADTGEGGNRRRRRGRRGRGRGRGENGDGQNGDSGQDEAETDDHPDTGEGGRDSSDSGDEGGDASGGGNGSSETPSGSRRRRRRRRRGGGGSGSGSDDSRGGNDDPPQTEVHERDPKRRSGRGGQGSGTSSDEVQGITGSTRLEAKRQRRRDGREAGRRRQPILSESEFLARRESVDRVMVVREKARTEGHGLMTQVGVLEDKVLVEHFVTTESARSMVGNVYLGRVQNVLPSMEAAFVDIGRGRNGVLYAGEVNWEAAGLGGKARRIEQALKSGDMVLVQVTKDPIGQKGARLSTQISLAGRFLVYVPDGNSTGISRKLPDTERRRLKAILKEVVPENSGVIIRTAAEGVSEEEIGRDVARLSAQWSEISEAAEKRKSSGSGAPVALYEEPDLLVKVVRDLFNEDFTKLVIEGGKSWDTVHEYVSRVAPEMLERLERHENPEVDVFTTHRVDEQLAKALDRKVWLPSGGSLVIDRTEAMTVVDVNTGKYTGSGGNLEETVTKNNLEAAEEIVRQLRLRDVGGMVIIDFIDMVLESNRDLVLRRLTEALGRDRTRHQVSEVTSLGLVQLTRKKLGTGLVEAFSTPCEHCQGRGLIVHADPVHTESHNDDEPGGRRGRRRGGKGGNGGNGQSDTPKQTPKKDGPAPTAHPAALAMGRHDESSGTQSDPAPSGSGKPDAGAAATTTASVESSGSGTRSRRRSSRRAAGEGAAQAKPTTEDVTAGTDDNAPATDEAAVAAEADSAVAAVETADTEAQAPSQPARPQQEPATKAPASGAGATSGGRRPRRRSTRREAGAAATATPTATAPPSASADAPVTDVPAEAPALAEAPTPVVATPRARPARRRATRSTVAPEGSDGQG